MIAVFTSTLSPAATFKNPILDSSPDPQAAFDDGHYYFIRSVGEKTLELLKTKDITDLRHAEKKTIWTPPAGTDHSQHLWAPEIHKFQGKWYVYYAADDGDHNHHRMFVLENESADPMTGEFKMKARMKTDPNDNWVIDASPFEVGGQLYLVWSGWPILQVGEETACIYIAKMSDPWTISSERVMLSRPEFAWERNWKNPPEYKAFTPPRPTFVNEGPVALLHGDKVFVTYSASGCWTPFYCLGLLTAEANADLLEPKSWTKSRDPVFQQSVTDKVFGTGHNAFFKSPDGTEDWLLYHANDKPNECGGPKRAAYIQKIEWSPEGTPVFGKPTPRTTAIEKPSGTP